MPSPIETIVSACPDRPWNWTCLSANPSLTMEFVLAHMDLPWHWDWISQNTSVTMEFVSQHIELPWNWGWMSQNPNMTVEFVLAHRGLSWCWTGLSYNKFGWTSEWQQACRRLSMVRQRNRTFRMPGRWRLTRLIKTEAFCRWWYAPDMPGGQYIKRCISRQVS